MQCLFPGCRQPGRNNTVGLCAMHRRERNLQDKIEDAWPCCKCDDVYLGHQTAPFTWDFTAYIKGRSAYINERNVHYCDKTSGLANDINTRIKSVVDKYYDGDCRQEEPIHVNGKRHGGRYYESKAIGFCTDCGGWRYDHACLSDNAAAIAPARARLADPGPADPDESGTRSPPLHERIKASARSFLQRVAEEYRNATLGSRTAPAATYWGSKTAMSCGSEEESLEAAESTPSMSSNEPQPEAPHDAVLRGDEVALRSWLERGEQTTLLT